MTKITTSVPVKERFRTIRTPILYEIDGVDLKDYHIHGYLQGERVDKLQGLSISHFDQIQVVKRSTNAKKGGDFVHAIGYRAKENQFLILILKKNE